MKKQNLVISVIIVVLFVALIIMSVRWANKQPKVENNQNAAEMNSEMADLTNPIKQIIVEGEGEGAVLGNVVTVNYVGALPDGTVFDTSVAEVAQEAGLYNEQQTYQPFVFTLGSDEVISGWNVAVTGMKKGEVSQVAIPASYAYGETGVPGVIPANSPILFQIQVLDISSTLE